MSIVETKFRSLSRLTAECQRQVETLYHVDSTTVQKEVSELIKNNIRTLEQDIEAVKQLAEEQDRESSKIATLNRLGEYEHQLKQLKTSSRQAILRSKKRVEDQEKKNREDLFGIGKKINGKSFTEQYELKQRGIRSSQNDDAILRASSDVTEALKRTSTLMQQELEKSSLSASILAESSKSLSSTHSEYQNLGSLMNISKKVISQLEASDMLDRILLLGGLIFFVLVVLYIIKKRTYDVGISWISWITQTKNSKKVLTVTKSVMPTTTLKQAVTTIEMIVETISPVIAETIVKDEL